VTADTQGSHRIVVGVDGSAPSKEALAWACNQARLIGARVEAIIAWEFPPTYGYPLPVSDVNWPELKTQVITDAIAEVERPGDQPEVSYTVKEGNAAQVLIEAAAGADLLVVGSRGHGGFAEALLGSVGQHCVHRATCPVVVIRDSAADRVGH
jgi:nucleotide-binding universal stress UspA family protein